MRLQEEREALAAAGHRLHRAGMAVGTAGNLSVRRGDLVAVTPTGAVLGELSAEATTVIDLDGSVVEGGLAPTSEVPMHLALYRAGAAGAVAHAHGLASTAVACTAAELPAVHYAMVELGGALRVAPYATYGSEELAANVLAALDGRVAALLQNHGSVAVADTLAAAVARLELAEWAAELYARCRSLGTPRVLSEQELNTVAATISATGYGTTRPV